MKVGICFMKPAGDWIDGPLQDQSCPEARQLTTVVCPAAFETNARI